MKTFHPDKDSFPFFDKAKKKKREISRIISLNNAIIPKQKNTLILLASLE